MVEQDLTLPLSSIHDMLCNKLHIFPHEFYVLQQPADRNYESHIQFASCCWQNAQIDNFVLRTYSDECVFQRWKSSNAKLDNLRSRKVP